MAYEELVQSMYPIEKESFDMSDKQFYISTIHTENGIIKINKEKK